MRLENVSTTAKANDYRCCVIIEILWSRSRLREMSSFLERRRNVIKVMHIHVHLNNNFHFISQRIHFLLTMEWCLPQKTAIMTRGRKNCASHYGNGWWFSACLVSNLNGVYYKKPQRTNNGITWLYWQNSSIWESLKSSKMMIR